MDPNVAGSSPVYRPSFKGKLVEKWQAICLGVVQGIVEFLPVSSSAHLKALEKFLNIHANNLSFELACHLGTTFALIIFFRKEIFNIFFRDQKQIILFALALLPLVPTYLFFNSLLKKIGQINSGFFLIGTSFFLLSTFFMKEKHSSFKQKRGDVLFIGCMQCLALIPGFSRSGMTVFGGCFRGWPIKEATAFSFLLAIPAVLGGVFLEGIFSKESFDLIPAALGFLSSFLSGLVGVNLIYKMFTKRNMLVFAAYTFIIGVLWLL